MPDLDFTLAGIEPEKYAAIPTLIFKLEIRQTQTPFTPIHAIALRVQIRLDPARRRYDAAEEQMLFELFGRRQQWSQTLRSMLWTHAQTIVPAFEQSTVADLPVPCSFDFNLAATKYFDALQAGEIPLTLLFSGTVFYASPDDGGLQTAPISWEKEVSGRLPVAVWRDMMQQHYPNTAWLNLDKETFDRLRRFKMESGSLDFDTAIERLLKGAQQKVSA